MWTTRQARMSDYPFIARSYLRSNYASPQTRAMIPEVYYPEYKAKLEYMVASGQVIIACSTEDDDQIFGFCIAGLFANQILLHYLYVKLPFRKLGIATSLATLVSPELGHPNVFTFVTHQPKGWKQVSEKYHLIYVPQYSKETT